ncbi:MAG: hypothetical protein ACTHK6_03680 [Solirubrobacterales bacterium]
MRRIGATLLVLAGLACLPASAAAAGPPVIEYLAPHPLRNHEATVHFTVDPNGLETTYEVEYGFEAGEYRDPNELWDGELPAGEEPVAGKAKFPPFFDPPLKAGTEYHWRVVAENAAGKTTGPDETFTTTDGAPPATFTLAATEQTLSSDVLHGTVDPEGAPLTSCWFQVVSEVNLQGKGWLLFDLEEPLLSGRLIPCAETPGEIGAGSVPVPVHAAVTGLAAEPYEYRLGAANEYEDQWFGSEPALIGPVLVDSLGASSVGAGEATVLGSIYKQYRGEAAYWVEYGIGGLERKSGIGWLSAPGREDELEVALPCLRPDSEYTYRFAGLNGAGTVYGSERTFHTAAGGPGCSGFETQPGEPTPVPSPKVHHKHRRKHKKHRKHHGHHKRHRSGLNSSAGLVAPR